MIRRATFLLIVMLLSAVAAMAGNGGKKYTLVIDAGHGGKDPGAIGSISKEKDINLAVALAFGRYVEENCPDVNVIYTRNTDVFVTLQGRADIANKAKADLFISVHTNSAGTSANAKSARGFSTYTLGMHRAADNLEVAKRENEVIEMEKDYKSKYQGFDPNSSESYIMFEFLQDKNMEKSVKLASYIQKSVCSLPNRTDRNVHQAGFLVLRETSMPSCLLELGFITSPTEEQELNDKYTQDQIARSVYQAFIQYKDATSGLRATGKINVSPHVSASMSTLNTPSETITTTTPATQSASQTTPVKATTPQTKVEQKKQEAKVEPQKSEATKTEQKKPETKAEQKKPDTTKTAPAKPSATAAKTEQKTAQKTQTTVQPAAKTKVQPVAQAKNASGLVFKVQILSSSSLLNQNDPRLNDAKNVEYAVEDGTYKYTVGSSADYNEIYKLKAQVQSDFPQSFIVAYKDGKKMVLKDAIDEWKKSNK